MVSRTIFLVLLYIGLPLSLGAEEAQQPDVLDQVLPGQQAPLADQDLFVNSVTWDQSETVIRAQSESGSGDLASKSQNPISDLSSVPLQNNFDFGVDKSNRTRYVGNLQPVVPFKLNDDWNLIARTIVPFVNSPIGPDLRSDGIGDTTAQFFFAPSNPGKLIWGVGPSFILPTASDPTLGVQEWGAGVNAVALISENPIVAGVLFNQAYSFGGSTKPMLIQPFFNYNLPEGWFVSLSGEANADWEKTSQNRWSGRSRLRTRLPISGPTDECLDPICTLSGKTDGWCRLAIPLSGSLTVPALI